MSECWGNRHVFGPERRACRCGEMEFNPYARCANRFCNHDAQLHTPTGRMDDTTERGYGRCTAGVYGRRCACHEYKEKRR